MINLWISTFIWAFSFPVIGYFISGKMDSYFAIFARTFIAFLVFLPMMDFKIPLRLGFRLAGIGALQIGIMYIFYYNSFRFLSVSEVAMFTVFTPFYIGLIHSAFAKKLNLLSIFCIVLSVVGAFIMKAGELRQDFWLGFALIQAANLCFAAAQCLYKGLFERENIPSHKKVFAYFFAGASSISLLAFVILGDFNNLPCDFTSIFSLIYLGIIASSIGYLLWNKGSTEVDHTSLALMNNAVIPVSILINIIFFGAKINTPSFIFGAAFMLISIIIYEVFRKKSKI